MCKVIEDMRIQERKEGREEGREEGLREGLREGLKTAALRMLEAGRFTLEEVAGILDLPSEEVEALRNR